jgi:hypothetical protein
MELEAPPRPPKSIDLPLPVPRKLELCRKVNSWLVDSIKYTIDSIANIVIEKDIELTLENMVELTLQLGVYIKVHKEINREMEISIKYIKGSSFYVNFPMVEESVLITGKYKDGLDEDILV